MKLEWTARGLSDLDEITEYIAEDSPATAFAFVDNILTKIESVLPAHPNIGRQGRVEGTREWVAHKNYVIAYKVTRDKVSILAVMHSARLWPIEFK